MKVEICELPPIGTNAFLITNEDTKEAIIIDAPLQAKEALLDKAEKEGIKVVALLLTHGHFDHTMGGSFIIDKGVPAYAHKDDEALYNNIDAQIARYGIPGSYPAININNWIEHGQEIELIGQKIEIRHVPGHCPGNVLFYFKNENLAVVGDAIFRQGIGRYDLPGGDFKVLEKSIKEQIYTLPNDTALLPGHGPNTDVAFEKQNNPYVQP